MKLVFALALPAILMAQATKDPSLPPLLKRFQRSERTILLVEANPAWIIALETPEIAKILRGGEVITCKLGDPGLAELGIHQAGVHLFRGLGTAHGRWEGSPPSDLIEAFRQVGWKTREESIRDAIRENPERVDLRAKLEFELRKEVSPKASQERIEVYVRSLDELMNQQEWTAAFGGGGNAPEPSWKAEWPSDSPLTAMAQRRFVFVQEAVLKNPSQPGLWSLLATFSSWHPDRPRIYKLGLSLLSPHARQVPKWPYLDAWTRTATSQLKVLEDWPGLEEFSRAVLAFKESEGDEVSPAFSGVMGGTSVRHLEGKPPEVKTFTIGESRARERGEWLLLLLQAQLKQGRSVAALLTAQDLVQNGDPSSLSQGRAFAREAKDESVLRLLGQTL